MSKNWTIDLAFDLPTGVRMPDGHTNTFIRVDLKNADKKCAVIKVVNGEAIRAWGSEGIKTKETQGFCEEVSVHDNRRLAESRASKESRECKDIDTEFFAVDLRVRNRGVCYFINHDNQYGDPTSEEIFITDTSEWTLDHWKRIASRWNKADLARHFATGTHVYTEKLSSYNYVDKKWEYHLGCSIDYCHLPKPE